MIPFRDLYFENRRYATPPTLMGPSQTGVPENLLIFGVVLPRVA